jgi:DNA-binding GntR family transcriptional regulator
MLVARTRPTPLHEQIRHLIDVQISTGELPPGSRLPTEHEYARQFGVSLAPVRQALLALVGSGRVVRVKGRGTFVREAKVDEPITLLTSFTESLRTRGLDVDMRLLELSRVRADRQVADALHVRLGRPVVRLRRLAIVAHEPAAILDAYLPADRFGGLLDVTGFDHGRSLYRTLESEFGTQLGRADSILEVVRCDDERCDLLDMPVSEPVLVVQSVTRDTGGAPVEASWVVYRADRFRFTIQIERSS